MLETPLYLTVPRLAIYYKTGDKPMSADNQQGSHNDPSETIRQTPIRSEMI